MTYPLDLSVGFVVEKNVLSRACAELHDVLLLWAAVCIQGGNVKRDEFNIIKRSVVRLAGGVQEKGLPFPTETNMHQPRHAKAMTHR